MSEFYYSNDISIDYTDTATDEYLLAEALDENGDAFAGYDDPMLIGDSWTGHHLAPGITELKVQQRRLRVFLLVHRLRPRTKQEAEARLRALRRFSEKERGDWGDWDSAEPAKPMRRNTKIERGRAR